MVVKYWSRAGIMLTDWCNASCACCYAFCSPAGKAWMSVEEALRVWEALVTASPHGCRVHLTGGEVFGRFDHLLEVCRRARQMGLGPLEAIETNGYWATDEGEIRRRLVALDEAGMGRLTLSCDPYHQRFVPIDRARMLAHVGRDVLGPARIRVRWADWLADGFDTSGLTQDQWRQVVVAYAAKGRDRLTGRAAGQVPPEVGLKVSTAYDDSSCGEKLLRGRHVHVSPRGDVWPATCIGIIVGNALARDVSAIWRDLLDSWADRPVLGPLCKRGPAGLAEVARQYGFAPDRTGFQTKCQLCFAVRRHLVREGRFVQELGPKGVYGWFDVEQAGTIEQDRA